MSIKTSWQNDNVLQSIIHELQTTHHKGLWQVRVWDNNLTASRFWHNTIEKFMKKTITPTKMIYQGDDGLLVYKFTSHIAS